MSFYKINGYPWWVIDQVSVSIQENINKCKKSQYYPLNLERPFGKMHFLTFPYPGICYIRTCNKRQLIPHFARVNESLKNVSFKLRKKNPTLIMETGTRNKHSEKRKLRKKLKNPENTEERFQFYYSKYSISTTKCSFEE